MFGHLYCGHCKVTADQQAKATDPIKSDKVIISLCVEHGRCPCCAKLSNQAIYKIVRTDSAKIRAELYCNGCTHKAELKTTEPYYNVGTCYNKQLRSLVVVINLKNLFLNFITFNDGIKISDNAPPGHFASFTDVHEHEQEKKMAKLITAMTGNPFGIITSLAQLGIPDKTYGDSSDDSSSDDMDYEQAEAEAKAEAKADEPKAEANAEAKARQAPAAEPLAKANAEAKADEPKAEANAEGPRANPQGGRLTRDFAGNVIVTDAMINGLERISRSVVGVSTGPFGGGDSTSGFQRALTKKALERSFATGEPISLTGGGPTFHTITPITTFSEHKNLGKGEAQPEVRRQVNQHWAAKYGSNPKN